MPSFTIPIGTSDPVDLCQGLPLLPISAPRAAESFSSFSNRLVDRSITILFTRLKLSAYYTSAFGVCGPAMAFLFDDVSVNTSNPSANEGQIVASFKSSQQMQAGAFLGMLVGGGVGIDVQLLAPANWYTPWRFEWKDIVTASVTFEIDLLARFAELIAYLLSNQGRKGSFVRDASNRLAKYSESIQSFQFVGEAESATFPPTLTAVPEVTFPINLLDYIPGLRQFVRALQKVNCELSLGPSIVVGLPVTLSISSFTVEGGLASGSSATYPVTSYDKSEVTARGPGAFNLKQEPDRFTTNVNYTVGVSLGLSCHFQLSICKLFAVNVDTPTLDLFRLLSFPLPAATLRGSVSTNVQEPQCLLRPALSISLADAVTGASVASTLTGVSIKITLFFDPAYGGPDGSAATLTVSPPAPGLPTSIPVNKGATQAGLPYTFANTMVQSGIPLDPLTAPSAVADSQTYLIHAFLPALPDSPCTQLDVTASIVVINRVITGKLVLGKSPDEQKSVGPPYNTGAGALINANQSIQTEQTQGIPQYAILRYWYPYPGGAALIASTPIQIGLYNEDRLEHTSSSVQLTFKGGPTLTLGSPVTVLLPLPPPNDTDSFTVLWASAGPATEYTNRFFLVFDAGVYGRMEFWLEVWNWG